MTDSLPSPPAIDYTSRDFLSIRDDLVALIPYFMPTWTSRSSNDFGIVLLELFAYVADQNHYYADRIANEAYLSTATQAGSVIRIARMLGYTPGQATAATVTLQYTNNSGASVTIPAGSLVATTTDAANSTPIYFTTDSALTVANASSGTVSATEGKPSVAVSVGSSDGTLDQSFQLFDLDIIQASLQVYVNETGTPLQWTFVDRLINAGPYDTSFSLNTDENGVVYVVFGDGANGRIPNSGAAITANYSIGGGTQGNVAANTITVILDNTVPAGVAVTNQSAASGGTDAETIDSIRLNAPKAVTSLQRAVTLKDYANLAVTVDNCAKASAASTVRTAVTVYVAPQGGGGYDGSNNPTGLLSTLLTTVPTYLDTVKPVDTSVTVQGPTYVGIDITVNVHVTNSAQQSRVLSDATDALYALLGFDNVIFGDTISPSDVHLALSGVAGLIYADISVLCRTGAGTYGAVSLATNEIPVAGTITVTGTGGIT